MKTGRNYKFWFCTGSQDLYGDECLSHVAAHSKEIVEKLNASGNLPYEKRFIPSHRFSIRPMTRQPRLLQPISIIIPLTITF